MAKSKISVILFGAEPDFDYNEDFHNIMSEGDIHFDSLSSTTIEVTIPDEEWGDEVHAGEIIVCEVEASNMMDFESDIHRTCEDMMSIALERGDITGKIIDEKYTVTG